MDKEQKVLVKNCYGRILNEADKIDKILEGTAFRDEIYELVDRQKKDFGIEED